MTLRNDVAQRVFLGAPKPTSSFFIIKQLEKFCWQCNCLLLKIHNVYQQIKDVRRVCNEETCLTLFSSVFSNLIGPIIQPGKTQTPEASTWKEILGRERWVDDVTQLNAGGTIQAKAVRLQSSWLTNYSRPPLSWSRGLVLCFLWLGHWGNIPSTWHGAQYIVGAQYIPC